MIRTPRAPTDVSLADLMNLGYLSEDDFLPGGRVSETRRIAAEQAYSEFMDRAYTPRPSTAPSVRRRPNPPPIPPYQTVTRGSSSQFHRVNRRRDTLGSDRLPKRMTLDVCCVCYADTRDHVMLPCFHLCVCETCSKRVGSKCPMCRTEIDSIHRVYL